MLRLRMSKGQYRERGQRRRGFDDDDFSPPDFRDARQDRSYSAPSPQSSPAGQGPELDATVKMFNSEKGFGFVELSDGSGDAFLHIGVLRAAGHDAPVPGAKLRVQTGPGQKGPQVTAVLQVIGNTADAMSPRPRPGRPDPSTATDLDGTVKWFNPEKGFGFVKADDGGKDVFLHISVIEKAGLQTLAEGAAVSMRVVETQKGREAVSVAL